MVTIFGTVPPAVAFSPIGLRHVVMGRPLSSRATHFDSAPRLLSSCTLSCHPWCCPAISCPSPLFSFLALACLTSSWWYPPLPSLTWQSSLSGEGSHWFNVGLPLPCLTARWTVEELSGATHMPAHALRRKIAFWQSHGLLKEESVDVFLLMEDQSRHGGHHEPLLLDDDEAESAMASSKDQKEEELQVRTRKRRNYRSVGVAHVYVIILIAVLIGHWKQTGSNSSFRTSVPLRNLKTSVCGHYRGTQGPCIFLHCYFVYKKLMFDNSKRLSCAFVFSGNVVYFQRRHVRHNANYVAYAQMPGCPLCSIPVLWILSHKQVPSFLIHWGDIRPWMWTSVEIHKTLTTTVCCRWSGRTWSECWPTSSLSPSTVSTPCSRCSRCRVPAPSVPSTISRSSSIARSRSKYSFTPEDSTDCQSRTDPRSTQARSKYSFTPEDSTDYQSRADPRSTLARSKYSSTPEDSTDCQSRADPRSTLAMMDLYTMCILASVDIMVDCHLVSTDCQSRTDPRSTLAKLYWYPMCIMASVDIMVECKESI